MVPFGTADVLQVLRAHPASKWTCNQPFATKHGVWDTSPHTYSHGVHPRPGGLNPVSYTHLRAHETLMNL
eukprot:3425350-Prymnesium_polylepis.1